MEQLIDKAIVTTIQRTGLHETALSVRTGFDPANKIWQRLKLRGNLKWFWIFLVLAEPSATSFFKLILN
jgi:hypothetical protein